MVELFLTSSAALPPAILHQEHQGLCRTPKEFQTLSPLHGRKQDALRSRSVLFNAQHIEDLERPIHAQLENLQSAWLPQMVEKPLLIDVQDSHLGSMRFSLGIAAMCLRNEKIMKFLMSGSKYAEGEGVDVSLLSEIMGLNDVTIDLSPLSHILVDGKLSVNEVDMNDFHHPLHIHKQIYSPEPQLDFGGDLSDASFYTVHPDGRLLLTGNATRMEDLLSIVAECSIRKRSITGSKQALLVPYFTSSKGHGRSCVHKQMVAPTVAPLKSPEATKLKSVSRKRKNKRTEREKDLYQRNSFHACERLLSVMLDRRSSTAILSLKKTGIEISQLLTQFSAGIAGTGLAVIFSVLCKLACGRGPFCVARLLSTALGFGLVWLSWAINGLRDTIICVTKNSGKLNLKEDEIAFQFKRSMDRIIFRVATLVAVAVLRFA